MVHISCFVFFVFCFPHAKQAVYYVLTRGGMTSGLGGYSFSPADYCCSVFLLIALILSHRQTFFFEIHTEQCSLWRNQCYRNCFFKWYCATVSLFVFIYLCLLHEYKIWRPVERLSNTDTLLYL